ncbi:hypothetical protein AB0K80_03220 [Streptomyces sp. NPDC052682]|uniref:hypothetical protein n=1 Tax=Streptomyces sp. NPDC052682 TaxID=3154954 RepID=UPI00342043D3
MGIESDQVVYEYLSRVGDVAHQRQLSSAARMRLVAELRNEIDRRRARTPVDSPAAVRRILSRLGSPDEVVAAAAGGDGTGGASPAAASPAAVPVQRDGEPREAERTRSARRRIVPRPRTGRADRDAEPQAPSTGPAPPHLAAAHELGDGSAQPDWWRVTDHGPLALGDDVPGFVGGVEIPELLKPPPGRDVPRQAVAKEAPAAEEPAVEEPVAAPAPRRRLPRLTGGRWTNPLLLLAAGLLLAGAVLGNWFALLLGWALAYTSRRLTQAERKWAVMGLPSLAATAGLVWLWGRTEGRWGTPIAEGQMNGAVAGTWPWVVRGAAVASALFLVWRSQRQR